MGLHDLRHEISYCLCRSILLLPGGVGIGAEGEARIIVPKHTADRFHIYTVLESQGREGVSQVVEPDVLQPGVLQYLLVELHHRVGVVHFSRNRRGEHILVVRVLAVFLDQQIHSILWDGHLPNRRLCLRACLISSDEDGNEGESKNLSRNNEFTLTIFPKPAEFVQPAEKALYHPTTRQHNKSV